ncbi:ROK family protein [Calidithermus chliarophilus]|uniref:ROK family protein n=1 Tax=Calidithermus chliarophilus TaxID=52023 RepID=UPI00042384C2|nr:ROK family protein [Calidithermus chliarophilus]
MIAASIDFGGTKLMLGFVDQAGQILGQQTFPTPKERGPEGVADFALEKLHALGRSRGIELERCVGVGSTVPALANTKAGMLLYAPAHGWWDVPFARMLEERFHLPARIANDVNACALAELRFGLGRQLRNFLWVTVSTGVGSALILEGQLYEGSGALAGEIGHFVLEPEGYECGCGMRGCVEAIAAGPAIARRAREMGVQAADAREVARLAAQGDPKAKAAIRASEDYLAQAFSYAVNLLDLDAVVLGGGVSQSLDLAYVERAMLAKVIMRERRKVRVLPTTLGYSAALVGAASLVLPG